MGARNERLTQDTTSDLRDWSERQSRLARGHALALLKRPNVEASSFDGAW